MFRDKMATTAIPERVFALCKIVEKKPISVADLKEKMEPAFLQQVERPISNADSEDKKEKRFYNQSTYFSDYRTAAEELGLISISDKTVTLAVDPSVVETTASMRKYVNKIVSKFQNGLFYQVTQAYFGLGSSVLKGKKSLVDLATEIDQIIKPSVDGKAMRAWRFWVSYLGLGYLQDMFFIPNAAVFLHDIITIVSERNGGLKKGEVLPFGKFVDQIRPYCGIIMGQELENNHLNYGVSNGLRTLHDAGVIRLKLILDHDGWNLYPLTKHVVTGTITNITLCD